MAPKGTVWGTRLGFYLAAVGSAFGLGNLWRFPYVVAENGGGAFVLLYVMVAFMIGMPFLIAELSLGKISRSGVMQAMVKITAEPPPLLGLRDSRRSISPASIRVLPWIGRISVLISLVVLAYYAVISGWVLHFLVELIFSVVRGQPLDTERTLHFLLENGWLQIALTSIHLTVVAVVIGKGLEQGLEKWLGYSMPLFGVLLIILAARSLSLDESSAAMRFLFYPDFSRLRPQSLGQAVGHVMFTLSVGFGTMVTFGSYLREKASLPIAGFRVTTLDCLISLAAGIMIFPLVIFGRFEDAGPSLLFHAVPRLLSRMPGGQLFGIGFFLCLYLASLGASIGLLEAIVANVCETKRINRSIGAGLTAIFAFLVALLPALSSSSLSSIRIHGYGLLEVIDAVLINWLLPIVALLLSQVVANLLDRHARRAEFTNDEAASGMLMYRHWIFILRYVAPPIVLIGLVLQLAGLWTA